MLAVRESKRERAGYEAAMRKSDEDWDDVDAQEIHLLVNDIAILEWAGDVKSSLKS